ncbi:MAG: RluA family pseudouridine synthase [Anaerolineae bacterium]|nr:RluA family pseudouridine synthase [Anaerolineae bacterium]
MRHVTLVAKDSGKRLDRFVADEIAELSRSRVRQLIEAAQVTVNGASAKASLVLASGDMVCVKVPDSQEPELAPEPALSLDIVYEDADLLVVNKPAGVVVHPGTGRRHGSLLAAVLAYRPDIVHANADPQRPGIVHRLDRNTSGLLLVAATAEAQRGLRAQFKERAVSKIYLALVHGRLEPMVGAIEARIARDPKYRTRMAVSSNGRYARTEYRVLGHYAGTSYLEVKLLTGRTHQIRVHLGAIGYPVVGDRIYGREGAKPRAPRQFLHSHRLSFVHPVTGQAMTFTSPLPDDLQRVLDRVMRKTAS